MKKVILAAVAALICFTVSAQGEKQNWREKMMAEKIAFITTELNLTPEEAQDFWPIYNKAEEERGQFFKESHMAYKKIKTAIEEGATEENLKALIKDYTEIQKRGTEIDSKYFAEYIKVISAEKTAKLILSEEKFRRSQIHKLSGAKGGQRPGQRPGQKPEAN
ncbi:MAG: hypothetical protein K5984_05015 [Bacteroidales bacterium]|nr:hypothetical protein [Bacteroidales bacterium]